MNKQDRRCLCRERKLLLGFIAATLAMQMGAVVGADEPDRVAVAIITVLDKSGSMSGDRIGQAKKEILEKARQIRPSASTPWVVIPFTTQPTDVRTFAKGLSPLKQYLSGLSAGGGTSIASGLAKAISEVHEQFPDAQHLIVSLYSDGEDADVSGVAEQESRLDALFQRRADRGLGQTVIVRSWESANAELVANLKRGRNAHVIDAGEAALGHATLLPHIEVIHSSWTTTPKVAVRLKARIEVRGDLAAPELLPVRIRCATAGVEGDRLVKVMPGADTPKTFRLRLTIDPASPPTAAELVFKIESPPRAVERKDELLVTTLGQDRVVVEAPVPPLERTITASAAVDAGRATWTDPVAEEAEVDVGLQLKFTSDLSHRFRQPVEFEIEWDKNVSMTSGPKTIKVDKPGERTVKFRLKFVGQKSTDAKLRLTPVDPPAFVTFNPTPVTAATIIHPPAPVVTDVAVSAENCEAGLWTDLRDGRAPFRARLVVEASGAIRDGTPLKLVEPKTVSNVQLEPDMIGQQGRTLELTGVAEFQGAPHETGLVFEVEPIARQGAVTFTTPDAVVLHVADPQPAHLKLRSHQNPSGGEVRLHLGRDGRATWKMIPVVSGVAEAEAAAGLDVTVKIGRPLRPARFEGIPPFQPVALQIAGDSGSGSFFFDSSLAGDVVALVEPECSRIVADTARVRVVKEAPAKRYLLWGLVTLFSAALVAIPLRLLARGKENGEDQAGADQLGEEREE